MPANAFKRLFFAFTDISRDAATAAIYAVGFSKSPVT